MNKISFHEVPIHWLAIALFFLIFLFNLFGFTYRQRQFRKDPTRPPEGLGPIESSLLGLMALMLSFTFSMASTKFEGRRKIITEEANAIGIAILRADLYPDSMRRAFHRDYAEYLNARIAYYEAGEDEEKIEAALKKSEHYSLSIWKRTADYSHDLDHRVSTSQAVPAVSAMIDLVFTREVSRFASVPPIILFVLVVLILIGSFLVGYGHKGKRNFVLITGYALMTTIALYVILELDRPRKGVLNLNREEHLIVELKQLLKE
jgi:hypothetical protein